MSAALLLATLLAEATSLTPGVALIPGAMLPERGRPIAATVNTHWHLDHSSGNGRARSMLDDPKLSDLEKEEIRIFMATMAERDVLRPQVVVREPGTVRLAGKEFEFRLTRGAVTDADLWFYDPVSGVAVLGDLVTFPAPFFETACPADWRRSLDEVRALPFQVVIPGHGVRRAHGLCRGDGRSRPVRGRSADFLVR